MTKFTPGPWHKHFAGDAKWLICAPDRYPVCDVYGWTQETDEANARLIAAAPNMWVAIRNLVTALDDGRIKLSDNNRALVIETHLRAALELATGDSDG